MNFKLIGSSLFVSICAVILSIQLGWVYSVNAIDPLTASITTPIYEESTPTPTPIESEPTIKATPTPTEAVTPTSTETLTPTPTNVPVTLALITQASVTPTPQTGQAEAKKEESKSSNNSSDSKHSFTCTAAKPSQPIMIATTLSGKTKATIVWANGQGAVTSYVIWYGTGAGYYQYATPQIIGSGILSYTVNGLEFGKTYYFRVQPYNECMPGEYSKEGIAKTPSIVSSVQLGAFYPDTSYSTNGAVVAHESTTPVVEDKVLGDSYDYGDESDETFMQWIWNSTTSFFSNLFS